MDFLKGVHWLGPSSFSGGSILRQMVFEGLWSPRTHPKDFPVQAMWLTHFSDVIGATHPSNFSFWGEGQIATDGFRYTCAFFHCDVVNFSSRW